jgi:hypothetical protein
MTNVNKTHITNIYTVFGSVPKIHSNNLIAILRTPLFPTTKYIYFKENYSNTLSGIYLPYNSSIEIGNNISFTYKPTNTDIELTITSKIAKVCKVITFIKNREKVIYPNTNNIDDIKLDNPDAHAINIPKDYKIELFYKLDYDLSTLIIKREDYIKYFESLDIYPYTEKDNKYIIRGAQLFMSMPDFDEYNITIESACFPQREIEVKITY